MNLSSQNSTNYQTFIGQHYSTDMISITNPASYTQEPQLNPVVAYGSGFTSSLNEPLKSVNRLSEQDADENGFESSESLLAKLDSTNDSKRQKKLVPLVSTNKTATASSSSSSNAYYNCHYNSQSLTGSSISSNSSSTSSSPLSLSSPLHASVASNVSSSLQHYSNHLNLQIKQPIQSQSILANSNSSIISNYNQQNASLNQSYMYSDPTNSNIFNYNHSINKFLPGLDSNANSASLGANDQYSINQNNLSDLADSNLDDFSSSRIKIKKSKKDPITEYDSELAESIEFELGLKKQNGPRKNSWGNLSYAELITRAIESSCDQRLTLSQIYDWIVKYVPYFKEKFDRTSSAGWKNSIRHNLSLHNRFIRVQNESSGKSSWWMINPDVSKYQLNPNLNGNPIPNQMMANNEASNYIDSSSSNSMLENNLKLNMNDTANMDLNSHNSKLAASLQNQLSYSPPDSAKSTKETKSLANRRLNPSSSSVSSPSPFCSSSLKHDHSRLSPNSSSSNNYSALSPGLIKNTSSTDSSVNAKRNKITKHKLGLSKLNKNNLMYKNKIKLNNKHESQLDLNSSLNTNSNNNSNTNELKLDNLKCDSIINASSASSSASASSSSVPSSSNSISLDQSSSIMNDLMINRMPYSSQASDSLMTASSSAESSTSNSTMASLKPTLTATLSAPDQSTPPPAYSNLGAASNSSSILRAALQKSISTNSCLSNPPTPSATPGSSVSSSMINQSNFNSSPQAKQFNQTNSFIQSNGYNFNTSCQADQSSYGNYSSLYSTNSFNTTNGNTNGLQFVNLQHQHQQQLQTANNLGYTSPNESVYFSNMNSNQMLVSSPGSSISTSSSPSSSTSSSSSLTANMNYLNRTNNTNNNSSNTATTQLLKSKSPLVSEQQLYSSYTLQSQPLNSNQIYSNTFANQQQHQQQQQQQQTAYDSRSTNLFAPINNSTYYDLSKTNSSTGSLSGVNKTESSLASNHYIDDLSNYQDMLNSSNSNKPTISCYYN